MTIRPSRRAGAKTAERAPTTTWTSPAAIAFQWRCRSASERWLCSTATLPNRRRNRRIVCGVRLISGTRTIASRPRATTRSMAARYTSVLPLPVTPCSRNVPNASASRAGASRSSASRCSAVGSGLTAASGGLGGGRRGADPPPDRVDQVPLPQGDDRPRAALGHPARVGDRQGRLGAEQEPQDLGLLRRQVRRDAAAAGLLGHDQARPDPRAGLLLDPRRHHRIQRLAPRARVISGQPAGQLQHRRVDQRRVVQGLRGRP